ncbi:MAG: lipid II:glycine glycyltransferase FemX [bacterium]
MEPILLSESDDKDLVNWLSKIPNATVFHTPMWRNVLVTTYGYEPFYLAVKDGGEIKAILPLLFVKSRLTGNRLVSLPFSNICGPIGDPQSFPILIGEALRLHEELKAKAVEIRTQRDLNPIEEEGFSKVSYFVTSIVPLDPNPDVVWKRFTDRCVRTEVRQAIKKRVEVRLTGNSEDDIKAFYKLFVQTRLRHGVPPQPYRFFKNLWKHMWPNNMALHLAYKDGNVIGGLVSLFFGDTIGTAYIGSDFSYRGDRVHQALFWKCMENGCLKGFRKFDFYRTPKNSESQRSFKKRWNSYEVDLDYMYYPKVKGTAATIEETAKYKIMQSMVRRMPRFTAIWLGSLLYRHLG